jgi:hypothetical protein
MEVLPIRTAALSATPLPHAVRPIVVTRAMLTARVEPLRLVLDTRASLRAIRSLRQAMSLSVKSMTIAQIGEYVSLLPLALTAESCNS